MKILLEVHSNDTRIGATNDALDLARYGRKFGLDYILSGPMNGSLLIESNNIGVKTINYNSRQFSRAAIIAYCFSVMKWIYLLVVNRPDVVHINYPPWGPSLACAARILGIPIVVRAGSPYKPANPMFRWVDRFVANCKAQAANLLNSPVSNRVTIVGDLVNMDRFFGSSDSKFFTEAENGTVRLLFLGQLVERKGLDVLVNALSKVDAQYILYLVGGDWEEPGYPQDVKRLIDELGLHNRIFIHNHRDDALNLLKECDVFVLPSLSEARPRSIIEAMLVGKCVVSTKTGGIPTLIENGINGYLVEPGNVGELASILQMVIDEPVKRHQIARSAKKYAENMFNIDVTINKYKSLYEELLLNKSAAESNKMTSRQPVNILFHYSSQQVYTGSPKVLVSLIEGLERAHFTPYFLAVHEGELCRILRQRGADIIRGRTDSIAVSSLPRNFFNVIRLIRLLQRHRIALVHLNELGWNSELAMAARIMHIPVFFHIHNPERLTKRNINCNIGSKYLFVSNSLASQCNAHEVLGDKVEIVYNPIPVDKFSQGRSIRNEFGVPDEAPVVGCVAQISERKGIDIFIETAAKLSKTLPEAWFLVAGPDAKGEKDYAANMRQRVADLGLDQRFKFLGPRKDVENILASIDIFFLPTRSEPFGLVIAEAMSARVPVVTSTVGGIPEIIPDDRFGFALELVKNNFHDSILKLLNDTILRQSIVDNGYNRVHDLFNDLIFNKKISSLYQIELQAAHR